MMKDSKIVFLGAISSSLWIDNGKELSRNFHQGYRVYDSNGLSNTISSNSIGGLGDHSGLYIILEGDDKDVDT